MKYRNKGTGLIVEITQATLKEIEDFYYGRHSAYVPEETTTFEYKSPVDGLTHRDTITSAQFNKRFELVS